MLVDFTEIPADGDAWEMFTRDVLTTLGLAIESPPDRGADGGKDMLATEALSGPIGGHSFRWLVSCKHMAHSGKSVSESHEPNIIERVTSFGADGFLGVFSTLPSAGLNTRLRQLAQQKTLRRYRILDAGLLENILTSRGFSEISLRYLPKSHRRLMPMQRIFEEYLELRCAVCGRDLLDLSHLSSYEGLIILCRDPVFRQVREIHWSCKGACNSRVERGPTDRGLTIGWEDIRDLLIPRWYLRWITASMTPLPSGVAQLSDSAADKMALFVAAAGQRVFRAMTEEERARLEDLGAGSRLFGA